MLISFSTSYHTIIMKFTRLAVAFAAMLPIVGSAAVKTYHEPVDTATVDTSGWAAVSGPLRFSWVDKDTHFRQFATPPARMTADTLVHAWRGERLGLEALITATEATGPLKLKVSPLERNGRKAGGMTSASFMRYVISTGWKACGYPADTLPTFTVPDMIDLPEAQVEMAPRSVRPVWCTVEIPRDVAPGTYDIKLELQSAGNSRTLASLTARIDVNRRQLPEPKDYSFYLDLWQQPYSVSRYYGVEPWSDEHLRLMEPYVDMLARAGQKAVTVILFYEPWGEQSHDKFEPMVATTRKADGSWSYDYSVMDRYVRYMADHGIDGDISCFSMVPWELKFRYFDEPSGEYRFLEASTGSEAYRELWTDFLQSLAQHLRDRGWYDRAMIVMDERGLSDMMNAYRVAQKAVPGIRMSLAGSYHKEFVDSLDCYTLIKGDFFPDDVMRRRHDRGLTTLMYTCCATPAPSQFSNSDPADGAYLPVYATATGHDGYLHWSFMNWTDNPLEDSRFRMFAPGDTFFVYPDGRSSVRYERMVEGIEMSEKLRLLRDELLKAGDAEGLERLERALLPVRSGALNEWYPTSTVVNDLQQAVDEMSR